MSAALLKYGYHVAVYYTPVTRTQKRSIRTNRNSATQLNSTVPGAEAAQRGLFSSTSMDCDASSIEGS
jgi:hypothetical protein